MFELVILVFGFIFGSSLGSFIKATADRSLRGVSILGRSYCDNCKKQLRWYDLFPVISFVINSGKCHYCTHKIPISHFLVEVLMGALIAFLFFQELVVTKFGINFLTLGIGQQVLLLSGIVFKALLIAVLVGLVVTDLKEGLIPDKITYPAILGVLIYLVVTSIFKVVVFYFSLKDDPIGQYLLPPHSDFFVRNSLLSLSPLGSGLLAASILGLFFFILIVGTKGRGMGGGDLKLSVLLGLALGFTNSLVAILIAFIVGAVVSLGLVGFGQKRFGQTIPFGPFLSLGGIVVIFYGEQILNWYLSMSLN